MEFRNTGTDTLWEALFCIASVFVEQKAGSTEGDGMKSEKSMQWPSSKKRDLMLPGNSRIDCPATQGPLDIVAHIFNVKPMNKVCIPTSPDPSSTI